LKFRAKIYNKTNFNNYQINNRSTTSTGFSFMHTQSFDEFFERLKEKRKESQKEIKKDLPLDSLTTDGPKEISLK